MTLLSVAILVGTELVGAGAACRWAIGGLFQLGETVTRCVGSRAYFLSLLPGFFYFLRAAIAHEPIRG